jgi:phage terminase large subunit-like protein
MLAESKGVNLERLDAEELAELVEALEQIDRYERGRQYYRLFPDADAPQADGSIIHARDKYGKHLEFFRAGKVFRERCFMAANRVGKTVTGSYEVTAHLTGLYPHWWDGRRFERPIRAWAAGKTNETTRDIVQAGLLGEVAFSQGRKGVSGTGMVPAGRIGAVTWKQGVSDLVDTIKIRHASGGWSLLGLKSYQQGRGSFEGTAQHVIWLDEECPLDIYGECLIRTATTNGLTMLTFTPLDGLTETVLGFMPSEDRPAA